MNIFKKIIEKFKKFFSLKNDEDIEKYVFFLGIGDNLKSPLSNEREQFLLEQIEKGDIEAKNELIEHNLRLVVYISKKFLTTGHHIDDLISIGSIGLIKAINSFKLDKNIKLATYASRCIENEILMFLRKSSKQKCEVSIDEPIKKESDGNDLSLSDVIAGEGSEILLGKIEQNIEHEVLLNCIKNLNTREQEIMLLRFGLAGEDEQTQKDVADKLEISQSYISRLEKKIISKLKKEMSSLK